MRLRLTSTVAALQGLRFVARASRRQFLAAAALQLVGAVSSLALVYAAKLVLDRLLGTAEGEIGVRDILLPLGVLAIATALNGAVSGLQSQQQRLLAEDVETSTWRDLLAVTGRVDLRLVESPAFAERSERIQSNAVQRPYVIATATLTLLGNAVTVVTLVVAVLTLEPLLVPVLLLAGLPSVVLSKRASRTEMSFTRYWSPLYRRRHYHRRLLSEQVFAKEVRSFQLQDELERRHIELSRRFRDGLLHQVRLRQRYTLVNSLITGLLLATALAVIVWLVAVGRMGLAEAGAAVVAVRLLNGALAGAFSSIGTVIESNLFLVELHEFLAECAVPTEEETSRLQLERGIALRGVHYRYPGTDRDVLADVDIDVLPGQLVVLVGENGSGKSTLAKVVAGLYAPSAGRVCWDEAVVDDGLRAAVRRSVSVIFQDFAKYELSAADNVELAADRDPDRLLRAVRAARVDDVLLSLPEGLDTPLGKAFEGAVDLSGGQWQRVALARALVRDAPLLVLDEPSSALDPRAEQRLFADIRGRVGERAVLLISHRYSNLHLADRIYVLQDGRVVDSGTHDELIAREGLYAQLYTLQAAAYATSPRSAVPNSASMRSISSSTS
jgi:ATP-binding cassette subfamily B protein